MTILEFHNVMKNEEKEREWLGLSDFSLNQLKTSKSNEIERNRMEMYVQTVSERFKFDIWE